MYASSLFSLCFGLAGFLNLARSEHAHGICPNGIRVMEYQPVEIYHDDDASTTTFTKTYTIPSPPWATQSNVVGVLTTSLAGPIAGTKTVLPDPDCVSGCTASVRVTTVPGIITTTVSGPAVGKETFLPDPNCVSDCTATVRITTVPSKPGVVTTSVAGPTAGAQTIPPDPNCKMDCTTTIRITTVPAAIITTSASGPEAGTETIPPDANCQMDCTSTIRVTTIPESFITTTQPYTGTDPITGPTTVTTIPPSGTNPGTVVIETPPAPTPDQHCDNAGLEYAIYTHNFYNEDAPKYSSFNAESFKTETPFYSGITDRIGIQPGQPATDPFVIYPGAPSESYQFKAVDHKAFLYAPTSGIYTISVPVSDEITLVWIGNNAISGWTRENANLAQDYVFQGSTPKLYTVELTAGSYNPIRVFWANAQGEFAFEIGITAPNGDVIVNGFQANADYLVQFACDKSTPEFPPWGAET